MFITTSNYGLTFWVSLAAVVLTMVLGAVIISSRNQEAAHFGHDELHASFATELATADFGDFIVCEGYQGAWLVMEKGGASNLRVRWPRSNDRIDLSIEHDLSPQHCGVVKFGDPDYATVARRELFGF